MARIDWLQAQKMPGYSYVCGYCGHFVGPDQGYFSNDGQIGTPTLSSINRESIYICSYCSRPTYVTVSRITNTPKQYPGASFGNTVQHLPPIVEELYNECRRCMSVAAYTSSVLSCRKLLMHVAVEQGADANKSFQYYVDYLAEKGFVPPNGKPWVDHIRQKGNEATHIIVLMSQGDAEELLSFMEMLLKFVYEFPQRMKPKE